MTEAASESDLGEQLRALIRVARIARQRLAVPATQTQVQPGMTGVLSALRRAGTREVCHAKELATRCGLDASTISRVVTALVSRGLVERTADPADGRASILTLTAEGAAALADIERQQADLLAGALRGWTGPEIEAFTAALTRFVDGATTYLDRNAGRPAPHARTGDPSDHNTPTLEAAL
ncbi:MarR family winged helix-turn-helix transcriptional regulator [Planosporangium mesophilum]|nr:MarR family transcriptional regulator [Planosporangium mesophilum]